MTAVDKGTTIKNLRLQHRMTLDEVGEHIGVSKQTLYKYENNIITNIPSDKVEGLAKLFNVSPALIMGWENSNELQKNISNKNLSPRVERDIQKRLQSILDDMNSDAGLAFYNGDEEMDEETKELLRISLETSIRTAKKLAQEKFTPKKYKNEQSE